MEVEGRFVDEVDGEENGELRVYAERYDVFEKRLEAAANMVYGIEWQGGVNVYVSIYREEGNKCAN